MRARRWLLMLVTAPLLAAAQCPSMPWGARERSALPEMSPDSGAQVLYGATMVITDTGIARGTLHAAIARVFEEGERLEFDSVTITFTDSATSPDTSTLTAATARYVPKEGRLTAQGNVSIVGVGARRLDTPRLVFVPARNQFVGDTTFVYHESGGRQRTGTGFEADPQLKAFKATGN